MRAASCAHAEATGPSSPASLGRAHAVLVMNTPCALPLREGRCWPLAHLRSDGYSNGWRLASLLPRVYMCNPKYTSAVSTNPRTSTTAATLRCSSSQGRRCGSIAIGCGQIWSPPSALDRPARVPAGGMPCGTAGYGVLPGKPGVQAFPRALAHRAQHTGEAVRPRRSARSLWNRTPYSAYCPTHIGERNRSSRCSRGEILFSSHLDFMCVSHTASNFIYKKKNYSSVRVSLEPFTAELPAVILEVIRAEPLGWAGLSYRRYIEATLLPSVRRVAEILRSHAATIE